MEYFSSLLLEKKELTKSHSTKKTFHISLSIDPALIHFEPGDSVAIVPRNDPTRVQTILDWLGCLPSHDIIDPRTSQQITIGEFLQTKANLLKVTNKLKTALGIGDLPEPAEVEDALAKAAPKTLTPQNLASYLLPLLPRFYSIASSKLVHPHEVHLLVASLEYPVHGHMRQGVASHFLCHLTEPMQTHIPIYIQKAKHFHLPQSPTAPMIMIGPGTGVAPFRAFIQERLALQHPGPNWLFFGERNRSSDFYYEHFWAELEHQQKLRLDTAFSRDSHEKCYVQHRLYIHRKELWAWIQNDAHLYICGDASQMAKQVESTLLQIFAEEGKLGETDAKAFLKELRASHRYQTDVY